MTPYWQSDDGALTLHHGRWQETLASIPDGSVRLILMSPPYDNARTYEGTNEPVDFDELASFCLRVLCPGGVCAMVLDGAVNDGVQSTTPYEVMCSWSSGVPHHVLRALMAGETMSVPPLVKPPWRLLQVLAYGRRGAPGAYKGRFRRDHEPLIVMVKNGASHVCEKDRIASASKQDMNRSVGAASVRRRDGGSEAFGVSQTGNRRVVRNIVHRGSFWDYGMVGHGHDPSADTGHPATFSEQFAIDAVQVWSNPGEMVCDPFSGSGTVMKACHLLGRRFVGSERVKEYADISVGRLGAITAERAAESFGPLFGGVK